MVGHGRISLAAVICGIAFLLSGAIGEAGFIPKLDRVKFDDGEVYRQGCIVGDGQLRSRPCRFGYRNSKRRVVLFGDSHAAEWGPALLRLARADHWQVIVLTRASCPAALTNIDRYCNTWRHNSLKRIRRLRPGLVVVASAANYHHYWTLRKRRGLDRQASERPLVHGMIRTLRYLKRWSRKVVLIRDHSAAPFSVTDCLRRNPTRPQRCDFRSTRRKAWSYEFKAAGRVDGVGVIDPQPMLCPDRRCYAVDGRHLVYRNYGHLAAAWVRTRNRWLGRNLNDPWNGRDVKPVLSNDSSDERSRPGYLVRSIPSPMNGQATSD